MEGNNIFKMCFWSVEIEREGSTAEKNQKLTIFTLPFVKAAVACELSI